METLILANEILLPEVARLVAEGNEVTLKTKGNSMLPFITGDRDSVVLVRPEVLSVGDIVLAEVSPAHYVLHRIYALQEGKVELMGDGNFRGREHCRSSRVVGKVKFILKKGTVEVDCNSRFQRFRAWIWRYPLYPFRRIILAIRRRLLLVVEILFAKK